MVVLVGGLLVINANATAATTTAPSFSITPVFSSPAAFDVSPPLRDLAAAASVQSQAVAPDEDGNDDVDMDEGKPEHEPEVENDGFSGDGVRQATAGTAPIGPTLANFDGLSNQDNFDTFGFRVNPPDVSGDVGPNHYVEMINLVFAVFAKNGTKLLGPVDNGTLWSGFSIDECTDPSGDTVVLYDQIADRWLLTQFTTRGINFPNEPLNLFYNCVAISTTGDPTGSYYRYAFNTGFNFPDYPKYGIWRDSYLITTREFGILDPNFYGIGVYGLDRNKMIEGDPDARAVSALLDSSVVPINLIGDGLLPADLDGKTKPKNDVPAPIIGTQDNNGPYGAPFDALNVWEFDVHWNATATASLVLKTQLPVASFDSAFPCGPSDRDCLPQPGITNPAQFLDILSYRQRPLHRLAYRNTGGYEAMVTNQSVEAAPGVAGVRWYEIRRTDGTYTVHQQGTYAPGDGVHRWMGSIAQDKFGNTALGFSVVNGTSVFPGIRYTGRLAGDPLGQMTQGEGTIISGSGVQRTTNSRWGDYTTMSVDSVDDCTFWYINEYYTLAGQVSSTAGWQTRVGSFKLPGC
ncbi:MAG: hypothetical protein ACM30G_07470 [Micromonosporaceae bacterium]